MVPEAMIFVFWMLSFKPTFSLSSFTFKRLFSSSSLSAKRVVYLESIPHIKIIFFYLSQCLLPKILSSSCWNSWPPLNQTTSLETSHPFSPAQLPCVILGKQRLLLLSQIPEMWIGDNEVTRLWFSFGVMFQRWKQNQVHRITFEKYFIQKSWSKKRALTFSVH